jgi:hypothetical protein
MTASILIGYCKDGKDDGNSKIPNLTGVRDRYRYLAIWMKIMRVLGDGRNFTKRQKRIEDVTIKNKQTQKFVV